MLNRRNRIRLHHWGRHFFRNRKQCPCQRGDCVPMTDVSEGMHGTVYCNYDIRTIERGIYVGARISMFRNVAEEPNVIVAVGDARYVLDRRIAREIRIKID